MIPVGLQEDLTLSQLRSVAFFGKSYHYISIPSINSIVSFALLPSTALRSLDLGTITINEYDTKEWMEEDFSYIHPMLPMMTDISLDDEYVTIFSKPWYKLLMLSTSLQYLTLTFNNDTPSTSLQENIRLALQKVTTSLHCLTLVFLDSPVKFNEITLLALGEFA